MIEFLCFHGSPGIPADFHFLKSAVPSATVLAGPRAGYPGFSPFPAKQEAQRLVVGYSWGARSALEWARSHSAEVDGVILISPYLQASQPTGGLKGAILALPLLGEWILRRAAPTAIEAFLTESSSPAAVPAFYRAQEEALSNPTVLLASILEKTVSLLDLKAIERTLSSKPALILWGAEDKTSSEAVHIAPLRSVFSKGREVKLEAAGHALVYTHPDIISAEINKFIMERK